MRTLLAAALAALALAAAASGAGGFPHATFTTTLSGKSPAFLNGSWRLTFLASGRYTIEHPLNETVAHGRITTSGATVVFGNETGPVACSSAGRYRWGYDGRRLRLTAISEPCGGRGIVLASKPLTLVAG